MGKLVGRRAVVGGCAVVGIDMPVARAIRPRRRRHEPVHVPWRVASQLRIAQPRGARLTKLATSRRMEDAPGRCVRKAREANALNYEERVARAGGRRDRMHLKAWVDGDPHLHRQLEAIKGNQRQSEAIRCNQMQSGQMEIRTCTEHTVCSTAPRSYQRPSEAIRGHQRPSEAIRGHQRQ